jgi:AraC-like DNA-binding protein
MISEVYGFLNIDEISPAPLRICDFGIECRQKERYDFKNDERGNYEGYLFQYTIDGAGMFETSNNQVELSKGKAFLVSFPSKTRYYLPENSDKWHYFYIHFTGPVAHYFYEYVHEKEGDVFLLQEDSHCIELFMKEFKAIASGKKYAKYESGEFLYRFLTTLCQSIEKPLPGSSQSLVDTAKEWMQNNYMTGKNISDMCEELKLSTSHVTREFHMCMGEPPIKYMNKLRIEHSMFLLINTDLSIGKIALQSGFSNANYYSKVFRRKVGMMPTLYRESFRTRIQR